jgi:3-hydroxyisobutyrate dehydrogenase
MSEAKPKLGYIGIGLMGEPMTLRLLKAGYRVAVWNRTRDKLKKVVAAGAIAMDNPAEVTRFADIVLTCVTEAKSMDAVVFGPDGIATAPGTGKILVDHSSIAPDATRDFSRRLEAANGMRWVDAPVSGGTGGAEAGTLAIMAGGDAADFAKVKPVVMNLAGRFTHMGPSGAGQTTKLVNQIIVASTIGVVAEAVRFAEAAGVDAGKLTEALAGGWADSKPFQVFAPRMVHGHTDVIGEIYVMHKDLDAVAEVARQVGAPLPISGLAHQIYRLMMARGHAHAEPTEIADLYSRKPV